VFAIESTVGTTNASGVNTTSSPKAPDAPIAKNQRISSPGTTNDSAVKATMSPEAPDVPIAADRDISTREATNAPCVKATLSTKAPDTPTVTNRSVLGQVFPISASTRIDGAPAGEIDADISMSGYVGLNAVDLARVLDGRISSSLARRLRGLSPNGERVSASVLKEAGLDVAYDAGALAINITTPIEGAPVNRISVNGSATPDPRKFQKPAFLAGAINYAVTQNWTQNERSPLQVDVRGFASVGRQNTFTLVVGGRWTELGNSWVRDPIRVVHDDFDRAIRYSAGEVEAGGTGWQSGGQIRGIVVKRAYSEIRPLDTLSNSGRSQFTLERDTRVTIEADGESPRTLDLARGRYDLRDLTSRI
jgi:outer membrane usher protein